MQDCNFPIIEYSPGKSLFESGREHGEMYRKSIKELAAIRKELMLNKNPALESKITELANQQWEINKKHIPHSAIEMQGIMEGSNILLEDVVILNNYTDFRDIQLPEEGCSTLYKQTDKINMCGQTWDMHKSAQNYLCMIHVKSPKELPGQEFLLLSLVGCLGLMGINSHGGLIGVNNINTDDARPGVIWPALIRDVLERPDFETMKKRLTSLPVTSGHNYILSDRNQGAHIELTPTVCDVISEAGSSNHGSIFHTNHCLSQEVQKIESKGSRSSTTHARFELLEKLTPNINTADEFNLLLKDHTNFPMSICSHYETGVQDPSFTCGAGTIDYSKNECLFWRGCKEHSDNYIDYKYNLHPGNGFSLYK